jgi:hypothetical protein
MQLALPHLVVFHRPIPGGAGANASHNIFQAQSFGYQDPNVRRQGRNLRRSHIGDPVRLLGGALLVTTKREGEKTKIDIFSLFSNCLRVLVGFFQQRHMKSQLLQIYNSRCPLVNPVFLLIFTVDFFCLKNNEKSDFSGYRQ